MALRISEYKPARYCQQIRSNTTQEDSQRIPDDSNHTSTGFLFLESVQAYVGGDDGLVKIWVVAEKVLDDHHRFLNDVIDFCLDQLKRSGYTAFRRRFHFDSTPENIH